MKRFNNDIDNNNDVPGQVQIEPHPRPCLPVFLALVSEQTTRSGFSRGASVAVSSSSSAWSLSTRGHVWGGGLEKYCSLYLLGDRNSQITQRVIL